MARLKYASPIVLIFNSIKVVCSRYNLQGILTVLPMIKEDRIYGVI